MTPRTKSVLIVVGTFIIGMIIGSLLTTAYVHHRRAKLEAFRQPDGFVGMFHDIIQPSDPTQQAAIDSVIRRNGLWFAHSAEQHRIEYRARLDSMAAELHPLLSAEQNDRLQHWMNDPDRMHGPGPMRGPGPGSPRGPEPGGGPQPGPGPMHDQGAAPVPPPPPAPAHP